MPRVDYKTCKDCGKHASEVGPLSHTRLCGDCGVARERQCIIDLATHDGAYFQYWRARIAASVGYGPLDDMPVKP